MFAKILCFLIIAYLCSDVLGGCEKGQDPKIYCSNLECRKIECERGHYRVSANESICLCCDYCKGKILQ